MNFQDCFRTVRTKFRDCFRKVRVKFLGLFSDSMNKIFGTVFRQSRTVLRFFFFYPGTDVFGFVVCFGITIGDEP